MAIGSLHVMNDHPPHLSWGEAASSGHDGYDNRYIILPLGTSHSGEVQPKDPG